MDKKKKILIVTPLFPWPETGACQQDRAQGIRDFIRYGYDVRVITKVYNKEGKIIAEKVGKKLGINIYPVLYKFKNKKSFFCYLKRIINPFFWDGAAFEYTDREIKTKLKQQVEEFSPDFIYFDYTYLWPLYSLARKSGAMIVTRSINFEPFHFLEESGRTLRNYLKYIFKFLSEYITIKKSDLVFSITPREAKIYKKLGVKKVVNLPLRGLPKYFDILPHTAKETNILNVYFMGSTYNVFHNKQAVEFLLKEVVPMINKKHPGKFVFHILGDKFPDDLKKYLTTNVYQVGYVENLDKFLFDMDIAIVPSLFGAGMQQKIFEPLARGFPVITQKRGVAEYGFNHNEHLIAVDKKEDFIESLSRLLDFELRKFLSLNARKKANELFNQEKIDSIIKNSIK